MKKKILILVILGSFIGGYMAYTIYNKPHRDIASEKASFKVTANKLFDEFDENEKSANDKYLDKVIEVSGTVTEISKDQTGNNVLTLEAENAMAGGVLCAMKNNTILFKENENVNLKCKCTGFLMDVVLTECTSLK